MRVPRDLRARTLMAAISGALCFDGSRAAGDLAQRMASRMSHRSPDGIRLLGLGSVALGFGALHATEEAARDSLPLRLPDGSCLVVDGLVHEREVLARALGIDRDRVHELGDAALLGQAWLRWREEMWRWAPMEYALGVWEPAHGRLTLARDRIGLRPLYYAMTAGMLAFASEAEALIGLPGVGALPNPDRVASNLAPTFDDGDRRATLYRGVHRVLPGECVEAKSGGQVMQRRLHALEPQEPLRLRHHADYVALFRETFDAAVRACARGSSPPALMLSGGIDSAAIHASAMAQGLRLRRVSVVADQRWAEDERTNIEILLEQARDRLRLDVPWREPPVDPAVLVREAFVHAHPVRNSIPLPMLVAQAAAASGSRALLDGIDGDLVTATPDNYIGRMALAGHPLAAWREARAAARTHTYLKHRPAWWIAGWGVASRLEPGWLASGRYRLADARYGDAPYDGMLHPDLVSSLRVRERSLEQRIALRADPAMRTWTGYRDWLWANPGFMRGGEGFDSVAARFGMEARHPWCDPRVVDLARRLPIEVMVREGWTKHVARAAYSPELAAVAWHSGKQHLGPQVTRLMLEAGRQHVDEALADRGGVLEEWIDPRALTAARVAWRVGTADLAANDRVLSIVTLQCWLAGLRAGEA